MKTQIKQRRTRHALLIAGIAVFSLASAHAEDLVQVTADNYVRAESDFQMKGYAEAMDAFGKFAVNREHYPIDNQVTVRGNRDTIYMFGIFDLTSPLTITMPDPGDRYMSLQLVNQDHSIPPFMYGPTKKYSGHLFVQRHHRQEGSGWQYYDPLRCRPQGRQLPSNHGGLELPREALSAEEGVLYGSWTFPAAKSVK